MQKIKNNTVRLFLVAVTFFVAVPVFASEFYFTTDSTSLAVGQEFKIDLLLDTENESINAVEGEIFISSELFEIVNIVDGNSIVNFWLEKPIYKDGQIVFSGITPGGYNLKDAYLFSFILRTKTEGVSFIKLKNVNALLNDGLGTKSKITLKDLKLNISGTESQEINQKIIDNTKPDTFLPEISQDINLFDNKWFVVFVAQDKGLGIDKYEIRESRYTLFNFSKWLDAESPYVLLDQNLSSYISIKAIDQAGNYRIVKLSPQNPIPWYANFENWFIIILVILVASAFYLKRIKSLSR